MILLCLVFQRKFQSLTQKQPQTPKQQGKTRKKYHNLKEKKGEDFSNKLTERKQL